MNVNKKKLINIACTVYNLMAGNYDRENFWTPYNTLVEDELEKGGVIEKPLGSIYENCNIIKSRYDKKNENEDIEVLEEFLNVLFELLYDISICVFIVAFLDEKVSNKEIFGIFQKKLNNNKKLKAQLLYLRLVSEDIKSKNLFEDIKSATKTIFDNVIDKTIFYGRSISKNNTSIWVSRDNIDLDHMEERIRKLIDFDELMRL